MSVKNSAQISAEVLQCIIDFSIPQKNSQQRKSSRPFRSYIFYKHYIQQTAFYTYTVQMLYWIAIASLPFYFPFVAVFVLFSLQSLQRGPHFEHIARVRESPSMQQPGRQLQPSMQQHESNDEQQVRSRCHVQSRAELEQDGGEQLNETSVC